MLYFTSDGVKEHSGPAIFMYIGFFSYAIYLLLKDYIYMCFRKYTQIHQLQARITLKDKEMKPYFENLDEMDIEWSLQEDAYFRDQFNLYSWDDSTLGDYEDTLKDK